MTKRRSLTPSTGMPNVPNVPGGHGMRRGGARLTTSEKVLFKPIEPGQPREGWALNVSRGGLRAILDQETGRVELGQEYEVVLGEETSEPRRARIVWLQEEPDGFVVGVEYVGLSGMHRAAEAVPPAAPPALGAKKPGDGSND